MDKKTKWSGAAVVALVAGAAHAGDRGQFQLTPYLGHANVNVEGRYLEFGASETYTQWLVGISAGYRAPFGLVVEIGTAAAGEPILGWAVGGEVRETYGAVGYDFELGRGWNITPKLGLTSWELQGGDLEDVVDGNGELRDAIDGDDAFLELAVTKHFSSHVGIGFSLRHAEVDFGSVSSAAFRFVWSL
jgi:hypothetical protein